MTETFTCAELDEIAAIIHDQTGIVIEPEHSSAMQRWLGKRLRSRGTDTAGYLTLLRESADPGELSHLLGLFLNHETFFFRDFNQLAFFAETCLPEIETFKSKHGLRPIRIWSAGCSTGEEAYTLAVILAVMKSDPALEYQVTGTDIDPQTIAFAHTGRYAQKTARAVPEPYLNDFFVKSLDGYQVSNKLRQRVEFLCVNLMDTAAIVRLGAFDAIFCKNVLFYFNIPTQERIIEHLYRSLNAGGYLFIDYSLTLQKIMKQFELESFGTYYYRKAL